MQVVNYALYLGDTELAKRTINELSIPRIARHIEPDGSQPHELARTKAFDYVRYNLEAFLTLARLAQHVDIDLWNYKTEDGRSIRTAVDWFAPYASGEKPWEGKQITEPKLNETIRVYRFAANGFKDAKYEQVAQAARERGKIKQGDKTDLVYPPAVKD